jgi:hypothetical protein
LSCSLDKSAGGVVGQDVADELAKVVTLGLCLTF